MKQFYPNYRSGILFSGRLFVLLAVLCSFTVSGQITYSGPYSTSSAAPTPLTLGVGTNTISHIASTPPGYQAWFDLTLPAGMEITGVTLQVNDPTVTSSGTICFNPLSSCNPSHVWNGGQAATSITSWSSPGILPITSSPGVIQVLSNFAFDTTWTLVFNVVSTGPSCDIAITGIATTPPSCPGGADGSLIVSTSCTSCVGTVQYSLDNTTWQASNTFARPAGPYTVYVRDSGATTCTDTDTATIAAGTDNTPPAITCPGNITVPNDAGTCGAVVTYTTPVGTDNCGSPVTTQTAGLPSGSVFPVGTTTNTFLVTDGAGNTASCSFTVTVVDNIDPVVNCVGNQIVDTNPGVCTYTHMGSSWDATATDNSSVTYTNYSDINNWSATASRGTTSITYETVGGEDRLRLAYNGNGTPRNGTYTYTITADKNETVSFDWFINGCHSWFESSANYRLWVNNTGNIIQTLYNGGGCAFSASGSSSFAVTAGTQWGIIVTGSHGDSANLLFGQFDMKINRCILETSYELTGATTGTGTTLGGVAFNIGETTVTWTATDASGNTDECSFTVTVADNEAPVITCVSNQVMNTDAGICTYTHSGTAWDATATDNCTVDTITYVLTGATTGTGITLDGVSFNQGQTTVTWTATDENSNTADCIFTVTIEDNETPILTAPLDITINTDAGVCFASDLNLGIPIVVENCQAVLIQWDMENATVGQNNIVPSFAETFVQSAVLNGGQGIENQVGSNVYVTRQFGNINKPVFNMTLNEGVYVNSFSFFHGHNHNPGFPTSPNYYAQLQVDAGGTGNYVDIGDPVLLSPATFGNTDIIQLNTYLPAGNNNFRFNAVGLNGGTNTGTEYFAVDNVEITYSATITNDAPVEFPTGETIVTWMATDGSGNTATDTQMITVEDNEAPVAQCVAPFTIQLDANGQASITAADIDAGSTDNCGIATIEVDRTDFNCTDLNTYVYALYPWSTTDNIYRYDFDPATLALSFESVVGSTGHNENFGFDVNPVTGEYYLIATAGSQRGLYTLNMNTFSTTLITPLTSTTGNTNAQDFAINNAGEFVILYQDGSVNKLDINTLTTTLFATVSTPGGAVGFTYDYDNDRFLITNNTNPVTLSELTSAGVQNTLFTFFTPGDSGDCTAQGIEYVGNGQCIASSTFGCDLLFSIDLNAESVNLIAQPNGAPESDIKDLLFSPISSNTHTVTLTVTDTNGNVSTCTTQVTVEDNIAPVITCVPNQTIDTDAGVCIYTHNGTGWDATATDNCSVAAITYELTGATTGTGTTLDGVVFNPGETTVTWTATDGSDNTAVCSFTVTVEDNILPTVITQNITVSLDANGTVTVDPSQVDNGSFDNCAIATMYLDIDTFTCADLGENMVILYVEDTSGNLEGAIAYITVVDDTAPIISCPADVVAFTEPGECQVQVTFANPSFIDNCSTEVTIVQTEGPSSGSFFPIGTTTVSFDVIDESGNTSSCSFTVTVEDNQDPVAVCQNITIQLDANGEATITAEDLDGGSTDNCSGEGLTYTVSQTDFDCSHTGENTITFTVTDSQGNSSTCTSIVTVVDSIAPEALCVAPFTIELDADGTASITVADIDAGSTDNCEITEMTLSQQAFTCADLGENEITLTVTDASGNVTTCITTVTVIDEIAPVVSCMDFTLELGEDGTATLLPENIGGESTDNCGITITAIDIDTFDCSDIGTPVLVTYFASDASGNISSCTAMVTVVDLLPPVITCPEDFDVDPQANGTYILEDFVATGQVSATDNCTDPVEGIVQSPAPGTLLGVGTHTISFTAEDEYGNEGVCTFELTVNPLLGDADLSFNSLTMYPNPAATTVHIGNPNLMDIDQISIYDIRGRLVAKQQYGAPQSTYALDVSNLSSAVYMVTIQTENKQTVKRLIVK